VTNLELVRPEVSHLLVTLYLYSPSSEAHIAHMLMLKTAIDQVVAGGFVKRDVLGKGGESLSETGGCASFIFLSCGAYHISCYLHTYTYYCVLSGSDCLKIQNHQNHKPAFMINRTCEDLKPLLAATGSHFDTGVGP
jgi:hypothetical protein